ncbi:MAG: hypothetical protein ACRD0P_02895 [Stackebrandtia sp.]
MLTDGATIIPGKGYIYTAEPGTDRPEYGTEAPPPWVDLGHTSEEGLTISLEVERTVKKTWRNRVGLRTTVDEVTFELTWMGLQFDTPSLMAYFGGGEVPEEGVFAVTGDFDKPYERALFIRLEDGDAEVDLYLSKVSLGPGDEAEISPEEFAPLPVKATVLDDADAKYLLELMAPHIGYPDKPVEVSRKAKTRKKTAKAA